MRISDWSSDVCSSDLAVVGLTEVAVDAGRGGRKDHPPVILLTQMWPGGAGDFVGTLDMDAVDQVPVGVIHFVEGLVPQDSGVVDHYIDPAERIKGILPQFFALGDGVVVSLGNADARKSVVWGTSVAVRVDLGVAQ